VGVSKSENGSLVKYVNGNGVAAAEVKGVLEVEDPVAKEAGRKRRVEEIGKEALSLTQIEREREMLIEKKKAEEKNNKIRDRCVNSPTPHVALQFTN
jgi:hypothetical protein